MRLRTLFVFLALLVPTLAQADGQGQVSDKDRLGYWDYHWGNKTNKLAPDYCTCYKTHHRSDCYRGVPAGLGRGNENCVPKGELEVPLAKTDPARKICGVAVKGCL